MPGSFEQACAIDLLGLVLWILAIPVLGLRANRSFHSSSIEVHLAEWVNGEGRLEVVIAELAAGRVDEIILRFPEYLEHGFQVNYQGNVR